MRIGITGHTRFGGTTAHSVRLALQTRLVGYQGSDLVGVTCLAPGADRIFADVVLELGGTIQVVVPSADYFDHPGDDVERTQCDAYLAAAASVQTMPFAVECDAAYLAASQELVGRCDVLLAVWDGVPGSGTADAVAYAHQQGCPTEIVWPAGALREAAPVR